MNGDEQSDSGRVLKRKIHKELGAWLDGPYEKALQIEGARQIGKSYVVESFLRPRCRSFLKIDFIEDETSTEIFEGSLEVDAVISRIRLRFMDFVPVPGDTILFFDEVQMCPNAVTSMKMFVDDGRFRVVSSGSLLGINLKKFASQPVGRVKYLTMHSLDFEEFLWALGLDEEQTDSIRDMVRERRPFGSSMLRSLNGYFSVFMAVGGMPEAVAKYLDTQDFAKVRDVQRTLVEGYRRDVMQYAEQSDRDKIISCFDAIPAQLSKESSKFVFSLVDSEFVPRFNTYSTSINWMVLASMVNICYNVTSPALPLESFRQDNQFKLYMHDTGMLTSMFATDLVKSIFSRDTRVNRGPIGENIIAECLVKCGIPIFYFGTHSFEIDFVVDIGLSPVAIEVKSGNNRQAKSLRSMKEKYGVKRRILFEETDIRMDDEGIEHYPMFVAAFADALYTPPAIDLAIDRDGLEDLKRQLSRKR